MSKQITAGELAEIVTKLLGDDTEIDDAGVYQSFMTRIAEVVCDHCGGEVRNHASDFDDRWMIGIHGNDSLPDPVENVWKNYDTDVDFSEDVI
jgi:hypothetical protein